MVVGNKVFCLNPETYLTDRVVVRQTNAVFRVEPDKGDDQSKLAWSVLVEDISLLLLIFVEIVCTSCYPLLKLI